MINVPLPTGIKGLVSTPKKQEYLLNMMYTGSEIIRLPDIEFVATSPDTDCRGAATWYADESPYFVIGSRLVRLETDETVTDIGDIAGTNDVVFSIGTVNLVIVVKGGAGYFYNHSNGLQLINDADYRPSDSADFIDGRHVFIPSDGSPAFYSEIDNPNDIGPLNFFDAEELPDLNRATINIKNNLYVAGSESFEIYRPSNSVAAPFVRREGARTDVGFVSCLERYRSSFVFIGRDREQNYAVHLMLAGETKIISNPAINELLNTRYTKQQIQNANSYIYNWKGVYIVGFNLPDITIEYGAGEWHYRNSSNDGTIYNQWRGKGVTFAYGRYYCGNSTSGTIGRLAFTFGSHESEIRTFVRSGRKRYFSISSAILDCLTGQEDATGDRTIGLSVSSDGRAWSDFEYVDLGKSLGDYNAVVQWAGGLGQYESYIGIRIRFTARISLTVEALTLT